MQRLDMLLVQRGLVDSRARAQRLIKEGRVRVQLGHWQCVQKSGLKLADDTPIEVEASEEDRYVSRGALKLAPALDRFAADLSGLIAIDVGQSTGGFTDCLLQHGAARVVGIEVGHDQLAERLRQDARVVCLEGYNARQLGTELLEYTEDRGFDLAVMDVSFISQTLILDSLAPLIRPGGLLVTLVKPQFEVGPEHVGKGGIVRDTSLYPQVRKRIETQLSMLGLETLDVSDSPILGGDGNREFVLVARKQTTETATCR
ncbi:TlyA family rRNA (cytidine-2'-O)-methyltransferase [Marinobacterium zhoushanense]|uniref:TlyA family rRNA (Cytidine-2'-O)-methyltransferase n=1 Tax=Marinobacterium zhoushanense TaxID=1679163 RepID=A0ABQ1JWD5_9GAMM|nr:TlyA family RNA methyltransferase [Marinobacterium zhoushanense]GGB80187.1 TlyA family rRNA (cytidine-2'-O)-methyltransferase [Marinobacterium zhoushanense]